jgi:diguanylate cyclase (GGDEF)-like protein
MPEDQLLVAILGATILVNVLLVASRSPRARGRRRIPLPVPVAPSSRVDRHNDEQVAAAVEAFVADISTDAGGSARDPTPAEVLARRQAVVGGRPAPVAADRQTASAVRPDPVGRVPARLAGLADAATWEQIVRDESARAARFRRPSMVVAASLPHLHDVAERWGRDAAERVVTETARLLVSQGRAVDHIARLGDATFGVLLPETGEFGASRYAERVRAAADSWLMASGLSVRLEIGWANVPNGADADAPTSPARPPQQKAARR